LQAVFFVPVLFLLYVKGDLNLADGMMLPFVWFLSVFPNWLLGRDFLNLTLIYGHQVLNYPFLTLNAANIYQFLPQAPYEIFVKAGIVLTVLSCVIFGIFLFEKASKKSISDKLILTVALFSLIMIPFLLPKMHERYFFAADLVSIVWVFYFPRKFYVSIFIITASFCSYVPFLFNADLVPMFIPAILMLCALAETGFILHRIVRE
jgi:Gpi18-like mannosyltransferase